MKKNKKITKSELLKLACICLSIIVILSLCILREKEYEMEQENSILTSGSATNEEIQNLELYAQAAVLMDAKTGRVLYSKNGNEILAMASTTKIMTCILALEKGNLEDMVEVSSYAASMPKVKLYMKAGESYQLKDLLYSLMLESHNDTAVAIAEHIGGSVEGFAAMMNEKAKEIGCTNSYFITPNGLDATQNETGQFHCTTAEDLAKIMSYCIITSEKREEFLDITRTMDYSFSNSKGRSFSCHNHNSFLTMMDGALTGKTGFTNKAGYCYVGALQREDRTFVVALLACGWPNHKTYKWSDSKTLMNYGLENFQYKEVFTPVQFEKIPVKGGIPQENDPFSEAFVSVKLEEENPSLRLLLGNNDKIEIEKKMEESLQAPVNKGTPIGYIIYKLNGIEIKKYPIVLEESVEKIDFDWIMEYILCKFLL